MSADKNGAVREGLGLPPSVVHQLVHAPVPRRLITILLALGTPLEVVVYFLEDLIPAWIKHRLFMLFVRAWVAVHSALPEGVAKRGLSDTLSIEAHAVNNLMWWSRLIPMTLRRLRFALSSVKFLYLPSPELEEELVDVKDRGVRGVYLRTGPKDADAPVLLWFFGGAFFGGHFLDNRGIAERFGRRCGCDVFVVDYALCPERRIEDAFRDGCRAYEWLLTKKAASKIILWGLSSGGGLALRVLQLARAPEAERRKYFFGADPIPQPAGAALLGPFVNFTVGPGVDEGNAMLRHQKYDLVVTPRVYEFINPQMADACGGMGLKRQMSPLFNGVEGLCPVLLSFSSHEVCSDDNQTLLENLRKAGNEVEAFERPYLPHAFQLMAFVMPECQEAEREICAWIAARAR